MKYDSTVPSVLVDNGFVVFQSLSFGKETKEAVLFKPEELSEFQQQFLNQFPFEKIPNLQQEQKSLTNKGVNKK